MNESIRLVGFQLLGGIRSKNKSNIRVVQSCTNIPITYISITQLVD